MFEGVSGGISALFRLARANNVVVARAKWMVVWMAKWKVDRGLGWALAIQDEAREKPVAGDGSP